VFAIICAMAGAIGLLGVDALLFDDPTFVPQLRLENWTVSIPTPVIAELESSGAPRPPPQPCPS
jgi:hypothetical protein